MRVMCFEAPDKPVERCDALAFAALQDQFSVCLT